MPDPTPGQIAYEAWWRARWPLDTPPHFTRYSTLASPDQRAWESAAQAVLADATVRADATAAVQAVVQAAQARLAREEER